jgi:hypothetical protein
MVLLRPQEWMLLGCWNFMEFLSSRHLMDQDLETFWCLWFRSTNASWWFMVHIVICQRNWPQLYTVMTIHAEFHPPTWQPKAESLRLAISDILFREAKPSRHLRAFLGAAIGAWPQLHAGFQSEHVWKYNIYIYVCDNRQGSEVPHGNVVPLMVFLGSSGLFHRVLKMVQQWSRKAEWRDAELSQTHPFSVNHENDETYRNENKWRPFSFIQLLSSSPNLSCQNCHSTSHNRHNRHNPRNQASTKIWYVPGQSPKDWIWHGSHSPSRGPGLTTHGEAMMSHHSLEIWETHT